MIPQTIEILKDFEFKTHETKTYGITDHKGSSIIRVNDGTFTLGNEIKDTFGNYIDGLEAVKQAIYLILSIERYDYIIYSWNYGVELKNLFGKPLSYVLPEIKRRVTEALLQDQRIKGVDNFSFETKRGIVYASFTVHTIYGNVESG